MDMERSYKRLSAGIFLIAVLMPSLLANEDCCGEYKMDTSETTVQIGVEFDAPKKFLENVFKKIPYCDKMSVSFNISGSGSVKDCCKNEMEIVREGEMTLSGALNANASAKFPVSPINYKMPEVIYPGTDCKAVLTISVGPYITPSIDTTLMLEGTMDDCGNENRLKGSASATGSLTAGLQGEVKMKVCDAEISCDANASATGSISGSISYDSENGSEHSVCFGDLTGDLSASFCFPLIGTCSVTIARNYVILKGGCSS